MRGACFLCLDAKTFTAVIDLKNKLWYNIYVWYAVQHTEYKPMIEGKVGIYENGVYRCLP